MIKNSFSFERTKIYCKGLPKIYSFRDETITQLYESTILNNISSQYSNYYVIILLSFVPLNFYNKKIDKHETYSLISNP